MSRNNSKMEMKPNSAPPPSEAAGKWFERARIIVDEKIKASGLSQAELARKIGTIPANVSKILSGNLGSDSIEWMMRFAAALEVDPSALLLGREAARPTRKLSPRLLIEQVEKFETYDNASSLAKSEYAAVRLLKDGAAATPVSEIGEQDIDGWVLIYASREWMHHDAEFYTCVRVRGYSMYPVLAPGDIVAIDHLDCDPQNLADKLVAFREANGATIKWLRSYPARRLVIGEPENRDERDSTLIMDTEEAQQAILGKVAWWWAKR